MELPIQSTQRSLKNRLLRLWPYFAKPHWYWGVAVMFTIILSLTEPLIPALMQPLLDKGFQKGNLTLWIVPVTIILLFAIRGGSNFIAQMALAKIANLGVLKIRQVHHDSGTRLYDAYRLDQLFDGLELEVNPHRSRPVPNGHSGYANFDHPLVPHRA